MRAKRFTRALSAALKLATVAVLTVAGLTVFTQQASAATKCKTYTHHKTCASVYDRTPTSFIVGYRDSIYNGRSYAINGSCQASTSRTVSHSVSVSVSAEVKGLIFTSFQASTSATLSKSMSTGYVTSASFKIPAKSTVYCDRGIVRENWKGKHTVHYYSAGAGSKTTYWTTRAPARAQWRIY